MEAALRKEQKCPKTGKPLTQNQLIVSFAIQDCPGLQAGPNVDWIAIGVVLRVLAAAGWEEPSGETPIDKCIVANLPSVITFRLKPLRDYPDRTHVGKSRVLIGAS